MRQATVLAEGEAILPRLLSGLVDKGGKTEEKRAAGTNWYHVSKNCRSVARRSVGPCLSKEIRSNAVAARQQHKVWGVPPVGIEPTHPAPEEKTRVILKKRGFQYRSDHLKALRTLSLDLKLDDYDFSQNEMVRAAVASFLNLSIGEQVRLLELNRRAEADLRIGVGYTRPGAL